MTRRVCVLAAVAAAAAVLAACGEESGGARTLNFFIFNEPGGGPQQVAQRCSEQSGGRYEIAFRYLPSRADQQREQLVRRLGAEDDTIDLIGMDIIWTGEFANAGWLAPVPADLRGEFRDNVFEPGLDTTEFEGRMFNVPIWSNTQLLWCRTDKFDSPPQTWDEIVRAAEGAGMSVQVQANRYEGLVVWTNAMIRSAGTSILDGPDEIALAPGPPRPRCRRWVAWPGRPLRRLESTSRTRTPRGWDSRPATPRSCSTTRSSIRRRATTHRRSST